MLSTRVKTAETETLTPPIWVEGGTLYRKCGAYNQIINPWGPGAGAWTQREGKRFPWVPPWPILLFNQKPSPIILESFLRIPVELCFRLERVDYEKGEGLELPLDLDHIPRQTLARQFRQMYHWLAAQRFNHLVPQEVMKAATSFQDSNWEVLMLFNRYPRAIELYNTCPALVYFLANLNKIPSAKSFSAGILINKPRKEICRALGFPASEFAVHFLSRLPNILIHIHNHGFFKRLLARPDAMKHLNHCRKLQTDDLSVAKMAVHSLFKKYMFRLLRGGRYNRFNTLLGLYEDVGRMIESLANEEWMWAKLNQVTSANGLEALHDELVTKINKESPRYFEGAGKVRYPLPPVTGTRDIVPVVNYKSLCYEGMVMHNCVASYFADVTSGQYYIYKVLKPQRCTLSLVKQGKKWHLGELNAKNNLEPSIEAKWAARQWLKERGVSC